MRIFGSLVLSFAGLAALAVTACGGDDGAPSAEEGSPGTPAVSDGLPDEPQALMAEVLRRSFDRDQEGVHKDSDASAIRKIGESGDQRYVPVLIDVLRFDFYLLVDTKRAVREALEKLTEDTAESEPGQPEWVAWVNWLGEHPEVETPMGYKQWKGDLFTWLVDPRVGSFLQGEGESNIPLEQVVWGGVVRDGIPDLQQPPIITAAEADYLSQQERVFGVTFNGESRAYPLRIMNPHEMANDEVGGVHFALAY